MFRRRVTLEARQSPDFLVNPQTDIPFASTLRHFQHQGIPTFFQIDGNFARIRIKAESGIFRKDFLKYSHAC